MNEKATPRRRRCPICAAAAAADARWRPFCSKRCRDIDLARWFGDAYRIPSTDDGGNDESEDESGDEREE